MNFGASFLPSRRFSRKTATEGERGWALVSVLWVVAILSMLAAATQALTLTSYKTEHRAQDAARAGADLDAAVARAAAGIQDPDMASRWRVDGVPRKFLFDGLAIRVAVQDQLGCIDLNTADISIIRQLLRSQGLSLQAADSIAGKIIDWRQAADLQSLHGADDADYAAAGLPYRERHAAFQSVDELQLLLGMTPGLYEKLGDAVTVYSHRTGFDTSVAPRPLLMALYADDPRQVDAIMAQRLNGGGQPFGNPNSVPPGILAPATPLGGRAFAVDASLNLNGRTFTRHAVIEMTGDDKAPYITLDWR
ncbi:MAG TPA: hypothetical protein VMH86_15085 [Rhizomicrobium sp.]|nr:hypothetical protein [Rhizomicrobium sp.]